MNVAVFWDIALCSPNVKPRFEGNYDLHLQGPKSAGQETSVQYPPSRLLHTGFLLG
jgi:hypothetical protein